MPGLLDACLAAAGTARVAVIDWNVHHGNGTQEGFYERDDVLTVSLHMDHGAWGPSHPQTGKADEIGRGRGRGFNLNVPLPMGSGDEGYARVFEELVVPAVDNFGPEMIVVAWPGRQPVRHQRPPAAVDGRVQAPRRARPGARRRPHGRGRLCLVQEGGYALTYAAFCLHATLEGVLGVAPLLDDPVAFYPKDTGPALAAIEAIRETFNKALAAAG